MNSSPQFLRQCPRQPPRQLRHRCPRRGHRAGFTMAEVLVATALAGIILSAAVYMFSQSVDVSQIVTMRGEMQQNARAAINLIARDISVAGTQVTVGGISLPNLSGAGNTNAYPRIGSSIGLYTNAAVPAWMVDPTNKFLPFYNVNLDPAVVSNSAGNNPFVIYAINPAPGAGPTIYQNVPTDIITIFFKDNNYPVNWTNLYSVNTSSYTMDHWPILGLDINGGIITVDPNTNPTINDSSYGLNLGDVLLVNNQHGSALVTVTGVQYNASPPQILIGSDPLFLNQLTIASGSLYSLQNFYTDPNTNISAPTPSGCAISGPGSTLMGCFPSTTVTRVIIVTYYIDCPAYTNNRCPATPVTPPPLSRLMRQVNALPPTPVAENIDNLQFSYDVLDPTTGTVYPNLKDPRLCGIGNTSVQCVSAQPPSSNNFSPAQISKVNIAVAFRSAQQRVTFKGYSHVSLTTSVTPRNLDFVDRYQ